MSKELHGAHWSTVKLLVPGLDGIVSLRINWACDLHYQSCLAHTAGDFAVRGQLFAAYFTLGFTGSPSEGKETWHLLPATPVMLPTKHVDRVAHDSIITQWCGRWWTWAVTLIFDECLNHVGVIDVLDLYTSRKVNDTPLVSKSNGKWLGIT